MKQENTEFALRLIGSILIGLNRVARGSRSEDDYLHEKVTKLHDLIIKEVI